MGHLVKRTPQIPVVLASLILWVSFAWASPAEAPAADVDVTETPTKGAWYCIRCGTANDASARFCTECGAKKAGEGEAAAKDPWAGVKLSDAYDYARCPSCGDRNEIRAERCWRCGSGFPQPSDAFAYPPWVFVPGKGYHEEGSLLEPRRSKEFFLTAGFIVTASGVAVLAVGYYYGSLVLLAVGVPLLLYAWLTRKEAVYAFENGPHVDPYERPAFALRSPEAGGLALKVEVTAAGF